MPSRSHKAGKGNGAGGESATLTLLESIRDELAGLRQDTNRGFAEVKGEVRHLSGRIDNLLTGPMGEMVRRHDREIAELREEMAQYRRR